MNQPSALQLTLFAAAWAIGIYLINCVIAREFKRVKFWDAVLHIVAMAMIGLFGEIIVGTVYHYIMHRPLWNCTILPIHHAYTSQFALFLWGIYGFHLYLLHGSLRKHKIESIHSLALIFCLEAVLIEALVNITYRFSFGNYIYYYFPSDLWHLTSIQTLPFYLIAGYVIIKAFRLFERKQMVYIPASLACVLILAFS